MAIEQEAGCTWPEQNAIDEFFSHRNLLPLKEAVTSYRIKVQEERDHFEKMLLMERETEESIRSSGRLAALREVRDELVGMIVFRKDRALKRIDALIKREEE